MKKTMFLTVLVMMLTAPVWSQCMNGRYCRSCGSWTSYAQTSEMITEVAPAIPLVIVSEGTIAIMESESASVSKEKSLDSKEENNSYALTTEESSAVAKINQYRKQSGLTELKIRVKEGPLARMHAKRMAQSGRLFHASGYWECVAMTPGQDPVSLWLNSPAHRAILMKRNATEIVIGRHLQWWTLRVW